MSEDQFEVVFRGDIVIGHQLGDVKARAARLFKIDAAKVDKLFSGAVVTFKTGLNKAQAQQYKDTLKQAGLLVDAKKVKPAGQVVAPTAKIRIAPVGAQLSTTKVDKEPLLEVDTHHLDVCPQEGYLLAESEREKAVISSHIDPGWDIAEAGVDLVAASDKLPELATIEPPDFEVVAAGEGVLGELRAEYEQVEVQVPDVDVLPAGEDLGESSVNKVVHADVDVSHLTLAPRPAVFKLD